MMAGDEASRDDFSAVTRPLSNHEDRGDGLSAVESSATTDGRRTRRVRNKVAVIDAYLDLVAEGNERPSVAEVAQRSGVSHRSVFRYFADKDDLARSSIERQMNRVAPHLQFEVSPDAPLPQRIDELLTRRFEVFEAVAPVARLMRLRAPADPVIRSELSRNRGLSRQQLRLVFAPELRGMRPERADEVVGVLDVLCSFEAGELLVGDIGFSPARSIASIKRTVLALLGA